MKTHGIQWSIISNFMFKWGLSLGWPKEASIEFSKDHLMSPFPIEVCTFLFPFSYLLILHILYMVTVKYGEYFRVWQVKLVVVLLILLACLGRSIPMVQTSLLGRVLWGVTLMSWINPFLRAYRLWVLFVFSLCTFFFAFLRLVLTFSIFKISTYYSRAWGVGFTC